MVAIFVWVVVTLAFVFGTVAGTESARIRSVYRITPCVGISIPVLWITPDAGPIWVWIHATALATVVIPLVCVIEACGRVPRIGCELDDVIGQLWVIAFLPVR